MGQTFNTTDTKKVTHVVIREELKINGHHSLSWFPPPHTLFHALIETENRSFPLVDRGVKKCFPKVYDVTCLMQVPGTGRKLKDAGLPPPPHFLLPFISTDTLTLHARRLHCLGSLLQLLCNFAPNSFKADLMKKYHCQEK